MHPQKTLPRYIKYDMQPSYNSATMRQRASGCAASVLGQKAAKLLRPSSRGREVFLILFHLGLALNSHRSQHQRQLSWDSRLLAGRNSIRVRALLSVCSDHAALPSACRRVDQLQGPCEGGCALGPMVILISREHLQWFNGSFWLLVTPGWPIGFCVHIDGQNKQTACNLSRYDGLRRYQHGI